jgi:hypothetical protein
VLKVVLSAVTCLSALALLFNLDIDSHGSNTDRLIPIQLSADMLATYVGGACWVDTPDGTKACGPSPAGCNDVEGDACYFDIYWDDEDGWYENWSCWLEGQLRHAYQYTANANKAVAAAANQAGRKQTYTDTWVCWKSKLCDAQCDPVGMGEDFHWECKTVGPLVWGNVYNGVVLSAPLSEECKGQGG